MTSAQTVMPRHHGVTHPDGMVARMGIVQFVKVRGGELDMGPLERE